MKIKVWVNKNELLGILSSHFGQTVVDVEVTTEPTIAKLIRDTVTQFAYQGAQKIAAIKALRQASVDHKWSALGVMGLADAKWAVEHFAEFMAFVEANDRLPNEGYSYGALK